MYANFKVQKCAYILYRLQKLFDNLGYLFYTKSLNEEIYKKNSIRGLLEACELCSEESMMKSGIL